MVYFYSCYARFKSAIFNVLTASKQALLFLMLLSICCYSGLRAQNPDSLVAMEVVPSIILDRNTPEDYTELNGKAVFTENTSSEQGLWVSDGTEYGTTEIIFEEWDGISLHDGRLSSEIGHANGLLYFLAEVNGDWNIWATDGTQEGTFEVVNSQTAGYSSFYNMVSFGDRVAFTAYSTNNTPRLYLINENNSGAEMVQSIEEVHSSHKPAALDSSLYVVEEAGEDRVLNQIDQDGNVFEVWQMPDDGNDYTKSIEDLTVTENKLFFAGNDGTGEALWVSNGGGATRLFNPHEDAEEFKEALNPIAVGDKVYFFSHPWDSSSNDFSSYAYLYISDGTESRTYQLWSNSLDENGYSGIDAANVPMAAAGNRLLFVAPDDPDAGTIWWTVGTTIESFEPVNVNGNTVGNSFSDPNPISVDNGAWFTNSSDLFFTPGTNDGAFKVPPEDALSFDHLAAINGLPWFSGRTSYSDDLAVWRVRQKVEIPDTVSLIAPENYQNEVSVLPTFEWSPDENADQYRIQITTSFNFSGIDIDTIGITNNTFTLPDSLAHEDNYYWRVQGINDGVSGPWSEEFSFETRAQQTTEIPDTVRLVSPENNSTVTDEEQPMLTWTPSESAAGYFLQFSPDHSFDSLQIDTTLSVSASGNELSDTTFTIEQELTGNESYFWRVKAANEAGESAWSQTFSFTVGTDDTISVPETPELTYPENEASIRQGQTPELTWTASENATEYTLHFTPHENFDQLMIDTTFSVSESGSELSDTTFTVEDELTGSENYFWRVKATNEAGESSWSETFSFLVVGGLSTEKEELPKTFDLQQNYPNPFNPTTVIPYQLPEAAHVTLKVYDMLGREMAVLVDAKKSAGTHRVTLNAKRYSSGMYIYRMQAGEHVFTRKLMLIK